MDFTQLTHPRPTIKVAMSNSRLRTMMAIGVAAVLSIAIVLTTLAVSRGTVFRRETSNDNGVCGNIIEKTVKVLSDVCDSLPAISVSYGGAKVSCDEELTIEGTESKPEVSFKDAKAETSYTLLMVDPDAGGSSVDSLHFYLHWGLANIKGSDLRNGYLKGKVLVDYFGPHPPHDTGLHRYQFVIFEDPKEREITLSSSGRSGFALDKFINDNEFCSIASTFELKVQE